MTKFSSLSLGYFWLTTTKNYRFLKIMLQSPYFSHDTQLRTEWNQLNCYTRLSLENEIWLKRKANIRERLIRKGDTWPEAMRLFCCYRGLIFLAELVLPKILGNTLRNILTSDHNGSHTIFWFSKCTPQRVWQVHLSQKRKFHPLIIYIMPVKYPYALW